MTENYVLLIKKYLDKLAILKRKKMLTHISTSETEDTHYNKLHQSVDRDGRLAFSESKEF
jgi:hypothetical protein